MDFMAQTLDTWPAFNELWQWRERGLPDSGGEQAVVAGDGNAVVGCVGIVPLRVSVDGQTTEACWQQDSLVSATMRGKGVGKKLVLEAEKDHPLIMAKGTSKAMYGLRKALGYTDVPFSDYLMCVNRPVFNLSSPVKTLLELALYLWQKTIPSPWHRQTPAVQEISSFNAQYDRLAENLDREPGIRPVKNAAYLNWRYFQCPLKKYRVFQAGKDHPRGAIVLGTSNKNPMEGWVVDLICASDDEICAYALLGEARRYFAGRQVKRILSFATKPIARRWLMRFGFIPTGRSPRFTYKYNKTDPISDLLKNAEWNFWHGDGDLDLYM